MEFLKRAMLSGMFSLLVLIGCNSSRSAINISKNNLDGSPIELSGFFFREYKPDVYEIVFLYNNSMLLNIGSCSICKGKTVKDIVDNHLERIKDFEKRKECWGTFSIGDSNIHIEQYFPIGLGSYSIKKSSGRIINPETFIIDQINKKKIKEIQTYKFHPYSPKPDITNNFIK